MFHLTLYFDPIVFVLDFPVDVRVVCHKSPLLSCTQSEAISMPSTRKARHAPPGYGRRSQIERWLLIVRAGEHHVWAAVVLLTWRVPVHRSLCSARVLDALWARCYSRR